MSWTLDMLVSRWAVDSVRKGFLAAKADEGKALEQLIRGVSANAQTRYEKTKQIVSQTFFKIFEPFIPAKCGLDAPWGLTSSKKITVFKIKMTIFHLCVFGASLWAVNQNGLVRRKFS